MSDSDEEKSQKRQERLHQLLQSGSAGGYERVAKRLREAHKIFHEELAYQLTSPLNKYLSEMPQDTLHEKQDLARFVQSELRRTGLAIRAENGEPANLHALAGAGDSSRFRISLIHRSQDRQHMWSFPELPKLELCMLPERREALTEYWARMAESRHLKGPKGKQDRER